MDWKEDIKARFVASIRKTFPAPTPLIGDRWFVFGEGVGAGASQAGAPGLGKAPPGGPAKAGPARAAGEAAPDFQFFGVCKLAKATGIPAAKVARLLAKNLDLSGLDARVAIEEEWKIHLWRLPPGSGVRNEAVAKTSAAGQGPEAAGGAGSASSSKDSAGSGETGAG